MMVSGYLKKLPTKDHVNRATPDFLLFQTHKNPIIDIQVFLNNAYLSGPSYVELPNNSESLSNLNITSAPSIHDNNFSSTYNDHNSYEPAI